MAISPDTTNYYIGPSVGLGNTPSYQASGGPFVTGSALAAGEEIRINFPAVTKEIVLFPTDQADQVLLSFAPSGSDRVAAGNHMLPFPQDLSGVASYPVVLNIKTDRVYVSSAAGAPSGWKIYAALTGINVSNMYALTGSGITD
jgi:hypothetical protein